MASSLIPRYTTHYFYLPKINAVNEGMIFIYINLTISIVYGTEWWHTTVFGIKRNQILLIILVIVGLA